MVVPTETLIGRVWGVDAPVTARRSLQAHLTRLRHALVDTGGRATIARRGTGYLLDVEPFLVDVHRFRQLRDRATARGCPPEETAALLDQALALWVGPALDGLVGEWFERTRVGVEAEALDAAIAWGRAALTVGDHDQVLHRTRALVTSHPLVEPLHVLHLRALHAAGRTAEAVDAYLDARKFLVSELGTEPGPDLRDTYAALLRAADDSPSGAPIADPGARLPSPPMPQSDDGSRQPTTPQLEPTTPQLEPTMMAAPKSSRPSRLFRISRQARGLVAGAAALAVVTGVATVLHRRSTEPPARPTISTPAVGAAATSGPLAEDFGGAALDPGRWNPGYEKAFESTGASWSPGAVRVTGGELRITGRGKDPTGKGNELGPTWFSQVGGP
jgi:SARP family transcriptional regulator, regulator of embCAB operon